MSHLHYYYYSAKTDAYELDTSTKHHHDQPAILSDPYQPRFIGGEDSFFQGGSDSDTSQESASRQNPHILPIHKRSRRTESGQHVLTNNTRRSTGYDQRSPHYGRNLGNYTDYQPRVGRSISSKLRKPRPLHPDHLPRESEWIAHRRTSQVPIPSVSQCQHRSPHACTCAPDFDNYATPHPRSSTLKVDTNGYILNSNPFGNRVPRSSGPYLSSATPLSRYSLANDSTATFNWRFSAASHYQHTADTSRRSSVLNLSGAGSRKLTKPRPLILKRNRQRAINSFSALSDLSPEPLSSIDIAIARLSRVSAPPLTLHEYLTSSKRRSRPPRKELADREHRDDLLRGTRPTSMPLNRIVRYLLFVLSFVAHFSVIITVLTS
jgi:hypothetical protein